MMRKVLTMSWVLVCVALFTVACGDDGAETEGGADDGGADGDSDSDGDGDTDSDADGDADAGYTCSPDTRVGGFRVNLAGSYTAVSGSVSNGVIPGNVPVEAQTEGACTLLTPRTLACDPPCTTTEVTCNIDGTCIPTPLQYSVGTVTITGMNTAVSMEPNAINFSYNENIRDPYPAFDEGAELVLSAAGGDTSPFSLNAKGVAVMETAMTSVVVDRDTPVALNWTPGNTPDAHVHIRLNVTAHGTHTGAVECVVPDTGSYEIPAGIVTELINLGLAGWPLLEIARRSTGTAAVEGGCVELRVFSQASIPVEIPGITSCSDDEDCPDGQTCHEDDLLCH